MNRVTVLDYARVVWRSKWWILGLVVVSAGIAFLLGIRQPKVYVARATILSPKDPRQSNIPASLGALLSGGGGSREGGNANMLTLGIPGISLGLPVVATTEDIFIALLKSRTLREEILREFSKTWGPSVARQLLSIETSTHKGVITLTVEAGDPKLAADLANAYFEFLDQRLGRGAEQESKRRETFYASQLERAAKEVSLAEEALLQFQSEKRMLTVGLDSSTRGGAEWAASLRAAIMSIEMQREVLRMRLTDQHPQMRDLEKQIAELKRQYSRNLFGGAMDLPPEAPNAKGPRKEFFVAAAKMTPVQFAFLKLFRNLKIQEAFYTAALQGLQQVKYEDGVTPTSVEILDPALPPDFSLKPNIRLMVQAAALSALIAGILLALVFDYLRRVWVEERSARADGGRVGAPGLDVPRGRSRTGARQVRPEVHELS